MNNDPTEPAAPASPVIEMVPLILELKRILVPFDFSSAAEKALRYATVFARQLDAKVMLLHVRELPYYPAALAYMPMMPPAEQPPDQAIIDRLESDARRLVPAGMNGGVFLRVGTPFDEICKAAAETSADLVIVSTHGYTGVKHVLMGSTAERVVRHAPCPVLVVREKEHEFA